MRHATLSFVCVLAVLLILVPTASAAVNDIRTVVNQVQGSVWQALLDGRTYGACGVTFTNGIGFWPHQSSSCQLISSDTQYNYYQDSNGNVKSLQINPVTSTKDDTSAVIFNYYTDLCTSSYYALCEADKDYFVTSAISRSAIDNYQTIPYPQTGTKEYDTIPILGFGWCGDTIKVNYSTSTIAPTQILKFNRDAAEGAHQCNALYTTFTGDNKDELGFFGSTLFNSNTPVNKYFTLPLTTKCENYGISIYASQDTNDWPLTSGIIPMEQNLNPDTHQVESYLSPPQYSAVGGNTFQVIARLNPTGYLDSIYISGYDGSHGAGGNLFTIYCLNPVDPDKDKNTCQANSQWDWNDVVDSTASGQACCGDDGAADVKTVNGYSCQQKSDGTGYQWVAPDTQCTAAGGTYIPGPNLGCCTPDKVNTVFQNSTDMFVCTETDATHAAWVGSSTSTTFVKIRPDDTVDKWLVSDGKEFLACSEQTGTVQYQTADPIINSGPKSYCDVTGTSTNNAPTVTGYNVLYCPPGDDTCGQTTSGGGGSGGTDSGATGGGQKTLITCDNYPGATCVSNQCVCSSTQTYKNGQCVTYVPANNCPTGYEWNETAQTCGKYSFTQDNIVTTTTTATSYVTTNPQEVILLPPKVYCTGTSTVTEPTYEEERCVQGEPDCSDNGQGEYYRQTQTGTQVTVQGCESEPATVCNLNTNTCSCPQGNTYVNGQCVTYDPTNNCPAGYEWNETAQTCGKYVTANTNSQFTSVNVCGEVQNQQYSGVENTNPTYICLDNWVQKIESQNYYLDQNSKYIDAAEDTTGLWRDAVKYVCQDGSKITANPKYSPDGEYLGFCNLNQCYNRDATQVDTCYNIGDWLLGSDSVCIDDGTGQAKWSSRTQVVAQALYDKGVASGSPFVLQCDKDQQSINSYGQLAPYTTTIAFNNLPAGFPSQVNNLCVLSIKSGSDYQTAAIGATTNPASLGQDGLQNSRGFIQKVNSTQIQSDKQGTTTTCQNAIGTTDGSFVKCTTFNPTRGTILYNSQSDAIILSADNNFQLGPSLIDNIRKFFANLRNTVANLPNNSPAQLVTFTADKIYVSQSGPRSIQGIIEPQAGGSTEGTVIYQSVKVDDLCSQLGSRVTCTELNSGGVSGTIIRISNPSVDEWEQLTTRLRLQ